MLPTLTLTLLAGIEATGAPCWAKYAPIIVTSPEPRVVVTTGDTSGRVGAAGAVTAVVDAGGLAGVGVRGRSAARSAASCDCCDSCNSSRRQMDRAACSLLLEAVSLGAVAAHPRSLGVLRGMLAVACRLQVETL